MPIVLYLWPGSAQPYNTRKGKTAGRLIAVFKYPAAPLNKGRIEQIYQEAKMAAKKRVLPKPRFLTVGYQFYESQHKDMERRTRPRQVPFLRLSGDWLQAAGFTVGQKARVQVTERGITIVAEE